MLVQQEKELTMLFHQMKFMVYLQSTIAFLKNVKESNLIWSQQLKSGEVAKLLELQI